MTEEKSVHKKHEPKEYLEHKQHKKNQTTKTLTWVFGGIAGIAIILLIVSIFTHGFGSGTTIKKTISQEEAKTKTIAYLNNLLASQGITATVTSISDRGDLYYMKLDVGGRPFDSYVTKDGALLFPSSIDMTKAPDTPAEPAATNIPKTDKPTIQLFVMSKCPYGVQAEDAFFPVIKSLGGKVNFELRFIANDNGDGTFQSLHGQPEVDEDLRQVCAIKYYPNTYFDYISCQNKNYAANKDLSTTWETCLTTASMTTATIKTCAEGTEGKDLLRTNIKLANDKQVGGSPTILINDVSYNSARTAAAIQASICGAFITIPTECSAVMNGTATAATGSC